MRTPERVSGYATVPADRASSWGHASALWKAAALVGALIFLLALGRLTLREKTLLVVDAGIEAPSLEGVAPTTEANLFVRGTGNVGRSTGVGAAADALPNLAGRDGGATDRDAPRLVPLNSATFEELRKLPGIGPKRATAILALRTRLGRFRRVEELLRVKGIGRKAIAKLRPLVTIDSPPAPSDAG